MLTFHDLDRPAPLHHREGLQTYLATQLKRPDVLDDREYARLGASAKADYNRQRGLWLSGGIVIDTPTLTSARKLLVDCFNNNFGRNSGHAGLMLDGDSTTGKTTTAKALMTYVDHAYRRDRPGHDPRSATPVVYVQVPAGSTGKLLLKNFADFFGVTVRSSETMVSIRARLIDTLTAAGTQLIVVDELQNLSLRGGGGQESVDVLKSLHNDLAATFVYAGIDLGTSGLLAGTRGKQLAARFAMQHLTRFGNTTAADKKLWKAMIKAFEADLPLRHHEPGSLPTLADYLWDRTSGSIGSLARLITGAAQETIDNRAHKYERIDEALMDKRVLDYEAERLRRDRASRKTTRGQGALQKALSA